MRGSELIAGILEKDYKIDMERHDASFRYKIDAYGPLTKITMESAYCCPVYVLFDEDHFMYYGDYGGEVFEMKTSIEALPLKSLEYIFSKVDTYGKSHFTKYEWNPEVCKKELLHNFTTSSYYEELDELEQERVLDFVLNDSKWFDGRLEEIIEDKELGSDSDLIYVQELMKAATDDYHTYIAKVHEYDDSNYWLYNGDCDLYGYGRQIPQDFYIVMYLLSIVQNEVKTNG